MDANKTYYGSSEATSGTFRPPLRSEGLAEPALLPVSPRSRARHTSAHHSGPGNSKPRLPWKPRSPAPSARTSSERRGRLPHPTGSPGRPRSPPRPGSPHAGRGHPLGVREPLAPRTARAGPRSEVGRRLGFEPPPQLQPEARGGPGGPTPPQRLVTLGGAGDGTAGRGRGSEPSGGRGNYSREDFHRGEIRSEKGKTPPARGEGRKAGLGQEEKTRRGRSREMYELS